MLEQRKGRGAGACVGLGGCEWWGTGGEMTFDVGE
jgi:hypothetical protein